MVVVLAGPAQSCIEWIAFVEFGALSFSSVVVSLSQMFPRLSAAWLSKS